MPRLTPAPTRAVVALAGIVATAGCGEDPAPALLDVVIETAAGENPLHTADADTLRVRVRQGTGELDERVARLDGDRFDLRLPLVELVEPIEVGVELTGPGLRLHGALPPFVATETAGLVRAVVGPPGSCEVVTDAALETGRTRPAVALVGTFALVAGGREPEGPSQRAGFLDLLRLFADRFEELEAPLGASIAAPHSAREVVLLSEEAGPLAFDLTAPSMQARPLPLHQGAGLDSALLARGEAGAVVIGGTMDGGRVRGVTWVAGDGTVGFSELAVPRSGAVAVRLGRDVLVAGGMAEGEPLAELLPEGGDGRVVLDALGHGVRDGAALFRGPSGERAILLGGRDASGGIRTDTLLLGGCQDGCESSPGPPWEAARAGAAAVPLPNGGVLIGGNGPSVRRDRVWFEADAVVFEELAPLAHGRSEPGAFRVPGADALVVVGGAGGGGPRRDVELCFPAERPGP